MTTEQYDPTKHGIPIAPPAAGMIYQLMPKVMMDIDAVGKTKENRDQGYKFRSIDAIYNAVNLALCKNGVFTIVQLLEITPSERATKNGGKMFHYLCRFSIKFFGPDGSFVEAILPSEGTDTGDKSANKAISFAHKYALLTSLAIPTEDLVDGDWTNPENGDGAPAAGKGPKPKSEKKVAPKADGPKVSVEARAKLLGDAKKNLWTQEQVGVFMKARFKIEKSAELSPLQYDEMHRTVTTLTHLDAMKSLEDVPDPGPLPKSDAPPPAEPDGAFGKFQGGPVNG